MTKKKEKTTDKRVAEIESDSKRFQKLGMSKKSADSTAFYKQINNILKFR